LNCNGYSIEARGKKREKKKNWFDGKNAEEKKWKRFSMQQPNKTGFSINGRHQVDEGKGGGEGDAGGQGTEKKREREGGERGSVKKEWGMSEKVVAKGRGKRKKP